MAPDPVVRPAVQKPLWQRAILLCSVALLGVIAGVLLLASLLAGEIYDYQDTVDGVHLPDVDAVVVLAGGRGRIAAGGDLWYRYWEMAQRPLSRHSGLSADLSAALPKIPQLYVSGMGHQATWSVFTRQLRRGVIDVIRPENVVLERESMNTAENAAWLVKYAQRSGWQRIVLVTSSYHMKRSRMVLEKIVRATGAPLQIETLSIFQESFEPGEWRSDLNSFRVTLLEYFKWVYYKFIWKP